MKIVLIQIHQKQTYEISFQHNYKNKQNNPKMYLEDVLLKDLDSTNFLGITFDQNLNWRKQT